MYYLRSHTIAVAALANHCSPRHHHGGAVFYQTPERVQLTSPQHAFIMVPNITTNDPTSANPSSAPDPAAAQRSTLSIANLLNYLPSPRSARAQGIQGLGALLPLPEGHAGQSPSTELEAPQPPKAPLTGYHLSERWEGLLFHAAHLSH